MKLIYKIVIFYLLIALVAFGCGGFLSYNVFRDTIDLEQKRELKIRLSHIKDALKAGKNPTFLDSEKLQIRNLGEDGVEESVYFVDTLAPHPRYDWLERNIMLKTTQKINDQYYYISLYDMMVEQDDVYQTVKNSILKLFLVLFLGMLIGTIVISKILFEPFNETLEKIKSFSLRDYKKLSFQKTSTEEFARLNEFIGQMTDKIRHDYLSLKEFSENASHEILTPLAIIKGKLELLINSSNLNDEDLKLIQSAQHSVSKLSKLSHSLTLLTKIENEEFINKQTVNISKMLRNTLFDFNELMAMKDITVNEEIQDGVEINIDANLADILLTNLIQNAIKHNVDGGEIKVHLSAERLEICNTGMQPEIAPEEFFERFKKGNQSEASIGLGLAIVKKICDFSHFPIRYNYLNNQHNITFSF